MIYYNALADAIFTNSLAVFRDYYAITFIRHIPFPLDEKYKELISSTSVSLFRPAVVSRRLSQYYNLKLPKIIPETVTSPHLILHNCSCAHQNNHFHRSRKRTVQSFFLHLNKKVSTKKSHLTDCFKHAAWSVRN